MTSYNQLTDGGIATLDPDGQAPADRLMDPMAAQDLVQRFILNDMTRSKKRAMVKGLVDGNPPYQASKLRSVGRSEACNVNWRMAESFVNAAVGLFYDIFSESPTNATIQLETGHDDDRKSSVATEEFDRLQKEEKSFDYNMQLSQYDMVLYGSGPFIFEDALDWRCRAFETKDLKLPDQAPSDANQWELAALLVDYLPHQLYEFIRNEKFAEETGWNIEATRQAIINACPKTQEGGQYLNWEWHQQQLKTGSFAYSQISNVISVSHLYYRQFPLDGEVEGRISHKIVLQNVDEGATRADNQASSQEFLFSNPRRFKNWSEIIHPMYYDRGNGGKHYSVTGAGIKMYSALEYQNRLMCKLSDDAFAAKVLFKPTTGSASQQMNLAQFGNYAVLPTGFDLVQTAINPLIQDGLMMNTEISKTVSSNLGSYRQNLQEKNGNPITATETQVRASEQSRLGNTQLARYYVQLDTLYAEKFRRATNPNLIPSLSGGKEALEFQKRCEARGVTLNDLAHPRSIQATRVVGQGSAYVRQQSLEFLLGMISMLPESGRANLIQDVIAARSGQFSVERYFPIDEQSKLPSDQNAEAMQWVAAMKVGVQPVVTETQNAVIYAQTYLQAAAQAAQSLEQGGNPAEVITFIDMAGTAAHAQLQRIAIDPTRKQVYDVLMEQWKQLAQMADQLKQHMQQQQEGQQQAQQQQSEQQMKVQADIQAQQAKTQADIQMKQQKNQMTMMEKQQKANQSLAINDAKGAQQIRQSAKKQAAQK